MGKSVDEKIERLKAKIQAIEENIVKEQQKKTELQAEIEKLELNAILDAVKKSGLSRQEIVKELAAVKAQKEALAAAHAADEAAQRTTDNKEESTHEKI